MARWYAGSAVLPISSDAAENLRVGAISPFQQEIGAEESDQTERRQSPNPPLEQKQLEWTSVLLGWIHQYVKKQHLVGAKRQSEGKGGGEILRRVRIEVCGSWAKRVPEREEEREKKRHGKKNIQQQMTGMGGVTL
jgi:hypothetical protein